MNTLLEEIQDLSMKEKKSLEQMGLKLAEETGEFCQALLSCSNANGSEYKLLTINDAKEECVDVVMVALSAFYKLDGNDDELVETLIKKIIKWRQKSHIV